MKLAFNIYSLYLYNLIHFLNKILIFLNILKFIRFKNKSKNSKIINS